MFVVVIIVIIAIAIGWLCLESSGASSEGLRSSHSGPNPSTRLRKEPKFSTTVYRPTHKTERTPGITFVKPRAPASAAVPFHKDIEGLHDAFTGALLEASLGLFQCKECRVYYHSDSYLVIVQENAGRCVACGQTALSPIDSGTPSGSQGRDYKPTVITLQNFRSHFGQVVTFEGLVVDIKTSRTGSAYAVMFERQPWAKGLKLIFLKGAVARVGGAGFIQSLSGRCVIVRGLIRNDPKYGPQILVTQRSMIMSVK